MRLSILLLALLSFPAMAAELAGTVQWSRRVELGTPVSGVVAKVLVESGQRVAKGKPLVQLDDRRFRAEQARARADVTRIARERDEAKREQARAQELYDRNLLSDHELEVQKIAFVSAESRYQAARAALADAELNIEYSTLRAPFDAWVLEVRAEVGQAVVSDLAAVPLVVIAESGRVIVKALVTEAQLNALGNNKQLKVNVGGKTYTGTVQRIGLEPAAGNGLQYPLEVAVNPGESMLRLGQKATIVLP